MKMKILNFGSCNIDYVYSLDHIVEPGETETTYKMETFSGGKGLNQSVALAKAGAEVYFGDENGEVQTYFNQDLNVIYGYVVLKQGLSPLTVTAIIALSIGFIGLIVAICVAFTRMGKKYREEMEKTEKNKGEQTCRS